MATEYRVKFDYHTHTSCSHGKGTIEENVCAAAARGLSGIAISDHGPGHLLFGIKKEKIPVLREEIERLSKIYVGMDIFLSVEANITSVENCIDIGRDSIGEFDFIIAGYHYGVRNSRFIANYLHGHRPFELPGRSSLKRKNTEMAVKAIYENRIKILSHPGDKGPFDITEIANACAERGTWLEINEHHGYLTVEAIKQAAKSDAIFVISSDAHSPEKVGYCDMSIKMAKDAGLDMERIVNVEGI